MADLPNNCCISFLAASSASLEGVEFKDLKGLDIVVSSGTLPARKVA